MLLVPHLLQEDPERVVLVMVIVQLVHNLLRLPIVLLVQLPTRLLLLHQLLAHVLIVMQHVLHAINLVLVTIVLLVQLQPQF